MSDHRSARPFSRENRPRWGLAARWIAAGVGALLVLGVLFGILAFVFGWVGAGVAVISPQNVRQQYSDAYGRFADLKATACNVKQERALVAAATDPSVQVQYQQQETAYEQNYRRIQAEYDAAYANAFAAQHVGPGDLPRTAPELEANIASSC